MILLLLVLFAVASRAYLGFVFSDCVISSLAIISLRRELVALLVLALCMRGSRKFHQGVGGLVLTTFLVINVFQRGVYESSLRSNWSFSRNVRTSISKEYTYSNLWFSRGSAHPIPSGSAHVMCVWFVCLCSGLSSSGCYGFVCELWV